MINLQSPSGRLLQAECIKRFGHPEDSLGRRIYGHNRIAQQHRDFIKAVLRGDVVLTAPPQVEPNALGSAGCGTPDGRGGNSTLETVVIISASRPTEGYDSPKVQPAVGIKPGPHSQLPASTETQKSAITQAVEHRFDTTLRAARDTRLAGTCVLAIAVLVTLTIANDPGATVALSSLPIAKIVAALFGRTS